MVILIMAGGVTLLAFLGWWAVHAWWWDLKFMGRLPPGSLGWPLLGESLPYLSSHNSSFRPTPFFEQRQARFGPLFKSHLFGEPVVVSTSPSINKFVFQGEGKLFKSSYPTSFVEMLGKSNFTALHGEMHAKLRRKIIRIVGSAALPDMISEIENIILAQLSNWEHIPIIHLHKEASKISFDLVVKRLVGLSSKDERFHVMMDTLTSIFAALITLPINLPGTLYQQGLKARAKVVELLQSVIQERKASHSNLVMHPPNDMLDALLEEEERDSKVFTRTLVIDVMVGLIYAAYETTTTTITFALMLLTKHQEVLDKLLVEHMSIKGKKGSNNKGLTWEDYKSMCYTKDVIYETLRLANIAPFLYRETLKDVEIDNYIIPKGWKVITSLSNVHMDAANYDDPTDFNPSRWKNNSKSVDSFMPFGGGTRLCAGNDLAVLEISIFLHHFITKYNWIHTGESQFTRTPGVIFKCGYPIKVNKRITTTD